MAQNINPFYSSQNAPSKPAEEKQNIPKDNHAVSKRYANFIKYFEYTLSTEFTLIRYLFASILLSTIVFPREFSLNSRNKYTLL